MRTRTRRSPPDGLREIRPLFNFLVGLFVVIGGAALALVLAVDGARLIHVGLVLVSAFLYGAGWCVLRTNLRRRLIEYVRDGH